MRIQFDDRKGANPTNRIEKEYCIFNAYLFCAKALGDAIFFFRLFHWVFIVGFVSSQ